MGWKKLNEGVEMCENPAFKEGKIISLSIDPKSKKPYYGVARKIIKRTGNFQVKGFTDESKLVLVKSSDLLSWNIVSDLKINGIEKIIKKYQKKDFQFIGLEDPDIFIEENGLKHLYFTIAYKNKLKYKLFLGHANGISLNKLKATLPVINDNKEISILPIKDKNYRYALAESWKNKPEEGISLLKFKGINKNWKFDKLILKKSKNLPYWCKGYASPCRVFDMDIINIKIKDNLLLGICNGNSGEYIKNGKVYRGRFAPGLFLFDDKKKNIIWIDNNPLFEDPAAKSITFASDLYYLNKNEIILYAHIEDSFVRAYKINLSEIRKLLPLHFL